MAAPQKPTFSQRQRILFEIVGILGAGLIRLMGYTWRVEWQNPNRYHELLEKHGGVIVAFWHSQLLFPAFLLRGNNIRIMISQSKDGEFIARTIRYLGNVPVRGSTSRGGVAAIKKLIQDARAGFSLSITPDGPRGPRYRAQVGVALMAKYSGFPVMPCGFQASRRKLLNSWDRFCIPRPFSRVQAIFGDPIFVAPDVNSAGVEAARQNIEKALQDIQAEADRRADP